MYDKMYQCLLEVATWPHVALLFALLFLMMGVFELRSKTLGYENKTLDGRWRGYSPEDARKLFADLGPDGRQLYASTERTLDVGFPLTYGLLFASLLILLYGQQGAKYLVLVPLAAAVMDLAEN